MPKKLLVTAAMFSLFCFQQGFAELKCYPPGPQDKGVYVYDETTNAPSRDPLPGECPANPPTGGVPINSGTTTPTQPPVTEPPATGGGTTTTPTTPTTPTNGSSEKFTEDEQKYLREKWEELKIESGTDISFDDYVKGIEFFSDPERFLKDGKEMKLIQDINGDGINDIDTNKDGIADTVFDPAKDSNVSELDNLPQADDMNGDGKADYDTDGDGKADLPNDEKFEANQPEKKEPKDSIKNYDNSTPLTYDGKNDKSNEKQTYNESSDFDKASNQELVKKWEALDVDDPKSGEEGRQIVKILNERVKNGDLEALEIVKDLDVLDNPLNWNSEELKNLEENLSKLYEPTDEELADLKDASSKELRDILLLEEDNNNPKTGLFIIDMLNERAKNGDLEALQVAKNLGVLENPLNWDSADLDKVQDSVEKKIYGITSEDESEMNSISNDNLKEQLSDHSEGKTDENPKTALYIINDRAVNGDPEASKISDNYGSSLLIKTLAGENK